MASETRNAVLLREVRTLFGFGVVQDFSDRQLLERYLTADHAESEAAFTFLVERHGPMVLHVCRQVLDDSHDAQDAFQATFLVFLRRARSIRKRDSLASWLFGVAMRVARRARYAAIVRRFHERHAGDLAAARSKATNGHSECLAALHEEIARLPERYREPIVLCHLEGLSTAVVARRLGCAQGTILSRLARGRERLRRRLTERGLAVPVGLLAASVVPREAAAALPAALVSSTVQAAVRTVAGRAALAATVPIPVAALAQATLRTMLMTRLTIAAAVLVTATAVAALTIPFVHPTLGAGPRAAATGERPQLPDAKNDQDAMARRELISIQGTWYRISSEVNGKKVPLEINGQPIPPKDPMLMIVFKDDGWYGVGAGGKTFEIQQIVKLDPTRRPKAIDLYDPDPNRNLGRPVIPGIYKLVESREGDTLTLCLHIHGTEIDRPTEFASKAGDTSIWLDVYRRDRTPGEKRRPKDQGKPAMRDKKSSAMPPPLSHEYRIEKMDSDQALSLAYAHDGKTLATAGFDGVVHLWDAVKGKQVGTLKGEKSTIRSVTFAPDGTTVACVNDAGLVWLWNVSTGTPKQTFFGLSEPMRQVASRIMLDSIAFAPDGHGLAVSAFGPTKALLPDRIYELRVFDVPAGQPRWSHIGRGEQACSLAFAPDGETLARAGWKTVQLWNAKTGEPIRTLYPTKGTIFAVAFTPDGKTLVGGGVIPTEDENHPAGHVTLWNAMTGQIIHTLEVPTGMVHAIAIAPDGNTVASGGCRDETRLPRRRSEVRLWDIATGRLLWTAQGEMGVVRGLAFAPDGKTLVYCDDDVVGVIDVQTAKIHGTRTLTRTKLTPRP